MEHGKQLRLFGNFSMVDSVHSIGDFDGRILLYRARRRSTKLLKSIAKKFDVCFGSQAVQGLPLITLQARLEILGEENIYKPGEGNHLIYADSYADTDNMEKAAEPPARTLLTATGRPHRFDPLCRDVLQWVVSGTVVSRTERG